MEHRQIIINSEEMFSLIEDVAAEVDTYNDVMKQALSWLDVEETEQEALEALIAATLDLVTNLSDRVNECVGEAVH